MQVSETEKNLLFFLRTRKPYEEVVIKFDREGKPNFFYIGVSKKYTISDDGIREVETNHVTRIKCNQE